MPALRELKDAIKHGEKLASQELSPLGSLLLELRDLPEKVIEQQRLTRATIERLRTLVAALHAEQTVEMKMRQPKVPNKARR